MRFICFFFRSYISFDILRRVLSDYFGYNVQYVMNITDIDDKIIKRARHEFLFEKYASSNFLPEKYLEDSKTVLGEAIEDSKIITDPDKKVMFENLIKKLEKAIETYESAMKLNQTSQINEGLKALLRDGKDLISNWLDKKEGHNITEQSIFSSVPRHWEAEFHKDMDALNVIIDINFTLMYL